MTFFTPDFRSPPGSFDDDPELASESDDEPEPDDDAEPEPDDGAGCAAGSDFEIEPELPLRADVSLSSSCALRRATVRASSARSFASSADRFASVDARRAPDRASAARFAATCRTAARCAAARCAALRFAAR